MCPMDVKGAIELARRLRELHGDDIVLGPKSGESATGAPPLFVWAGVDPTAAEADGGSANDGGA
jgi:hypothetical protein